MLLIKNAIIIEPGKKVTKESLQILVDKGKIIKIGKRIRAANARTWDVSGACVSIGFFDIGAFTGDPGFEHKEDLFSITQAAAQGGFTGIACAPNTLPVIHSKSEVQYVLNNTRNSIVDFYPIGAVSQNCEGREITEIYDMYSAGAVAFSDGFNPIQNSGLMMRSLLYVKPFDGVIINQAHDNNIAAGGMVHEGLTSTSLGLKGLPGIAEDLMVQRDIYLAEYTGSRLHVNNVSCARSVNLIAEAKSKGLRVTASVNPVNISFDDSELASFNSNLKVMPPLRAINDINALKKGLKTGVIDVLSSNHHPQDKESKHLEFANAEFGASGIGTAFSAFVTNLDKTLSTGKLVEKLAVNPRKMLNLPVPEIKEGAAANLCVFDPSEEWIVKKSDLRSKSDNNPFIGKTLKGRVLGVLNNGKVNKTS